MRVSSYPDLISYTTPDGDCRVWTRGRSFDGYGTVNYQGKKWGAHRLSLHLSGGTLVPGQPVHHKCGNKLCVNSEHLETASTATNNLEMLARKDYEIQIRDLKDRVEHLESRLSLYEEVSR